MNRLLDAVAYQGVWFAAVLGAGSGHAWPGAVAGGAFAAVHLADANTRASKLTLLLAGIGFGLLLDGALEHAGWVRHAAEGDTWRRIVGAPVWILALWAVFPLTLTCSFAALQSRTWLAAALGAIGGPLAYLGAARGASALEFVAPAPQVIAVLAVGWGIALPVLARLAARGRPGVALVGATP
ncbi:DUF2878 domain-containing protein [Cognatilysobacter lacus]|uniref:DUF2878 domain-containing protein n=1 Tax=Cognatilysobacter lacus TaxID=1643323 RepID=A0A5D8Z749_9GAMM|nr:DUF2878 domain-containing protein [Lysobacter lacus]TZF90366.1 DUF2878 domain-containing protein [Lysobacter lacus]